MTLQVEVLSDDRAVAERGAEIVAAAASRSSAQTGSGRTSAAPPGGRLRWSCVRLRSGSPSGAMRSSTWKIVTFSHGRRP